jgi:hypothetical protein
MKKLLLTDNREQEEGFLMEPTAGKALQGNQEAIEYGQEDWFAF